MAVRTSTAETTIDPVEIARHHNRKRKAAESSGRKDANKTGDAAERKAERLTAAILRVNVSGVEVQVL